MILKSKLMRNKNTAFQFPEFLSWPRIVHVRSLLVIIPHFLSTEMLTIRERAVLVPRLRERETDRWGSRLSMMLARRRAVSTTNLWWADNTDNEGILEESYSRSHLGWENQRIEQEEYLIFHDLMSTRVKRVYGVSNLTLRSGSSV